MKILLRRKISRLFVLIMICPFGGLLGMGVGVVTGLDFVQENMALRCVYFSWR